ncbi:MAG: hypothetical protein ACWGQW_22900, partial [bacterium]
LVLVCLFAFVLPSFAADELITAKVQSVTQAVTRNGAPYVRVIIEEKRELNGVSYTAGVPLMFFGAMVESGKTLKAGDTVKVIASGREFNGRTSYTAQALIE